MEQPRTGRRVVLIILAVALAAAIVATLLRPRTVRAPGEGAARPVPGENGRVVAEVLNASGQVGLARAATRKLRDAGIDVVYFGTDERNDLDATLVVLRRGDASAAERVVNALGIGAVQATPDATRLVDVTVRLGRDFGRLALVGEP
jgi:hypothetical protein